MNEAHDLGESERANRYALYERVKIYAAAPPDVLRCNEKYIRQLLRAERARPDHHHQPQDRRGLSAERRSAASTSPGRTAQRRSSPPEYFNDLWRWLLHEGGEGHVAAYLAQRDLSAFDPMRLPRQTTAFFDIVNAAHAPEDAELADVLDELGTRPDVCSLLLVTGDSPRGAALEWLLDRRHRRSIPHRMERCGYIACRNPECRGRPVADQRPPADALREGATCDPSSDWRRPRSMCWP